MTTDHWTSLANENYSAVTLHLIDDFQVKSIVLSCRKHEGGATIEEMQSQLVDGMASWALQKELFVAVVTDTAANMNAFGVIIWHKASLLCRPHATANCNSIFW